MTTRITSRPYPNSCCNLTPIADKVLTLPSICYFIARRAFNGLIFSAGSHDMRSWCDTRYHDIVTLKGRGCEGRPIQSHCHVQETPAR